MKKKNYTQEADGLAVAVAVAVAVAAKSSRNRFVAGTDFDLSPQDFGVDSSSASTSSSSFALCLPVSNVHENVVVPDLATVVASSSSAPQSGNVYNFHFN